MLWYLRLRDDKDLLVVAVLLAVGCLSRAPGVYQGRRVGVDRFASANTPHRLIDWGLIVVSENISVAAVLVEHMHVLCGW